MKNPKKFAAKIQYAARMADKAESAERIYWVRFRVAIQFYMDGYRDNLESYKAKLNDTDPLVVSRAQGFIDGYEWAHMSSTIGRPRVGEKTLPAFRVPEKIDSAIRDIAKQEDKSVGAIEREACEQYIENKNKS